MLKSYVLSLLIALHVAGVWAGETVYLPPDQFVAQAFDGHPPKPELIWMTQEVTRQATQILGHPPAQLRQRYWRTGERSVFVLEEIGKEELITAGFIIEKSRVLKTQVLVYRESRGGEIRHAPFLRQYEGAMLDGEFRLDRSIDGISGATLSVRAMERMARLALYLDGLK